MNKQKTISAFCFGLFLCYMFMYLYIVWKNQGKLNALYDMLSNKIQFVSKSSFRHTAFLLYTAVGLVLEQFLKRMLQKVFK
jgi:hypothetical protein